MAGICVCVTGGWYFLEVYTPITTKINKEMEHFVTYVEALANLYNDLYHSFQEVIYAKNQLLTPLLEGQKHLDIWKVEEKQCSAWSGWFLENTSSSGVKSTWKSANIH